MKNTHIIKYSILLALGLASVATVNTANKAQAKNYNYRVVTVTKSPYAIVHDSTGKEVHRRALALNSDWHSDKTITVNGTLYYQVSTDEWLRSEDVKANWDPATGKLNQETSQQQKLVGKINSTVVDIYYDNGSNIGRDDGRFKVGSAWNIGQVIKNMQGKYFYQVSTNEYISSDDMTLNGQPQNVIYNPAFGYVPDKPNNSNTNKPDNSNTNKPANPDTNNSSNNINIHHEPESAYQQSLINAVNARRRSLGLPDLVVNSKLMQAAEIRTSEQYNAHQRDTLPWRPDGSSWWSVLSEVNYDWSYARERNFVITDSTFDRSGYAKPENISRGLMSLYSDTYESDYTSPKAKEIGVSVRYNDDSSKVYTIIEVGAQQ